MRKRIVVVLFILLTALLLLFFTYTYLIPKTAALGIPYKWHSIPVKQSKNFVHQYFGSPELIDSGHTNAHERWYQGAKGRMYQLQIDFNDSMAVGYSIRYLFSNSIFSKTYLIDTSSTQQ